MVVSSGKGSIIEVLVCLHVSILYKFLYYLGALAFVDLLHHVCLEIFHDFNILLEFVVSVARKLHLAHMAEHCRVVVVAQMVPDLLRSLWRRSLGDKVLIVLLGHGPIRKLQRLIEFGGGLDDWGFRAGVARTVTHMLFDVGKSLSVACVSPTGCVLARVLLVLGAEDFPFLLTC